MATTKVSALSAKTSLAGSEELLINDSGTSKKVTATNLLAGVTVADGSISTAKIADDAVTEAKLANAINTAIAANTAKTSNATHTGEVTGATSLTITADAVTGAKIADNAIDSEHYADGSIDTAHIGDDQVTADKLANSINTDIATGVTAGTTANAALPKSGGAMTGNIVMADDTSIGIADDAERIEFDGAGDIGFLGCNVGIGTSTVPTSPENNAGPILQIGDGSNAMSSIVLHEDGNKWEIVSNNDLILQDESVVRLRLAQAGDITFSDASQAALVTIKNAGDVGIGTTSPAATLEVDGNAIAKTDTDTSNTGSVTLDFGANQNFVLTLTGNVTLANPSTEVVGQSGFITFIQDGTGSRTVSLGTDYETAGGAGLTLTSTASATDIVPYVVAASSRILLGTPQLAFS